MHTLKILFLCPYPHNEAPSQRFRFEQYFDILEKQGAHIDHAPFFSVSAWLTLYKDGKSLQKAWHILLGFIKRFTLLFKLNSYDYIFIHRETAPIGPPIYEWLIAKILKKKLIYDFDDAIWLKDPEERNTLKALLKCKWKVGKICRWSYKVSVGNEYLKNFAKRFNQHVVLNPTTIDTENHHNLALVNAQSDRSDRTKPMIGWTGTHSTLPYLKTLIPVIKELEQHYDFTFQVIANKKPDFELNSMQYVKWTKSSEVDDLSKIDIGIMPLTDDAWSRGKCGFKALQYLAMEKPALVSPVGVNQQIITDGVTGFFCKSLNDWKNKLELFINDPALGKRMGKIGRQFVESNYSVNSNAANFLSLFE